MYLRDQITVAVGVLLALLLQLLVAPHIGIGSAMVNFPAAFVMALAVTRPNRFGAVVPFVAGLIFDLFTGGPVGAMAFSLTAFSYLSARVFAAVDNDTVFIPLVTLAIGLFLIEFSYGMFQLLFGYPAGMLEALAFRIAPCFLYDFVVGVIIFFVMRRLLTPRVTGMPSITQLR